MSNPVNGTAVNFAFGGAAGITITGVSGILLQSAELTAMADLEETRDGTGAVVTHSWYNDHDEATLEWVVSGTGLTAAIANTANLRAGAFVTISACAAVPYFVATWEAQSGCKITGTNTNSKRISLPIRRYAGITAIAT